MTHRADSFSSPGRPDSGRVDDENESRVRRGEAIERELRVYYEAEAADRLRPPHGRRRREICAAFARRLARSGVPSVLDVGAGPATDRRPFTDVGVRYVGVDLAVGNAVLAAELDDPVVPASLFALPFVDGAFAAGWSMSTFQHVPDDQIDEALAEFVRVLRPGAPVALGLWGGRDEVIESISSTSGLALPRHFTLRTHDRIRERLGRHLVIDADEIFPAGDSDWEYHVSFASTPTD